MAVSVNATVVTFLFLILHPLFQTRGKVINVGVLFEYRRMQNYLHANVPNCKARHSMVPERGRKLACPLEFHVSITADRSWRW